MCICLQETWYTPPKASGKKIAGGKLVEKLRNTWRCLQHLKLTNSATVSDPSVFDDNSGMYLTCILFISIFMSHKL